MALIATMAFGVLCKFVQRTDNKGRNKPVFQIHSSQKGVAGAIVYATFPFPLSFYCSDNCSCKIRVVATQLVYETVEEEFLVLF